MVTKIWTLDPDEDKLMALLKQEVDMRSRLYNYPITLEAECYTFRPAVATVKLSNRQRQSIALEYVLLRILRLLWLTSAKTEGPRTDMLPRCLRISRT